MIPRFSFVIIAAASTLLQSAEGASIGAQPSSGTTCGVPVGTQPTPGANPYGPVFGAIMADPCVIKVDGTYYAFATNHHNNPNVPVGQSQSLQSEWAFDNETEALPSAGNWTLPQDQDGPGVWGPDVNQLVSWP